MKVNFDYSNLRHRINTIYRTTENFSKELGISEESLINKLNNKEEFLLNEANSILDLLGLDKSDGKDYFFITE